MQTRRIRSFADLDSMESRIGHVVSLFGSSLDSSYLLKESSPRRLIGLELLWTREAVEGRWFGALRESAEAFIRTSSKKVTGTVRYRLRQRAMDVCSVKSTRPLYLTDRGAWEKAVVDDAFVPPNAEARRAGDGERWAP